MARPALRRVNIPQFYYYWYPETLLDPLPKLAQYSTKILAATEKLEAEIKAGGAFVSKNEIHKSLSFYAQALSLYGSGDNLVKRLTRVRKYR